MLPEAKVALLFLARNEIPTEPLWAAFIASAAELSPIVHVPPTTPRRPTTLPPIQHQDFNAKCVGHMAAKARALYHGTALQPITNVTEWLQGATHATLTPRQLYERQRLFSIYVHRHPAARHVWDSSSIFYGRDIPDRIEAAAGQPSLVAAHRLLLSAALRDPANAMFVLVSETCVPLHHPALLWAQLMAEAHVSRVAARSRDLDRFHRSMATRHLRPRHFYKSSQWVSLTRMHAALAAEDQHVWPQFEAFCRSSVFCGRDHDFRDQSCIADEHYIATLLAVYGQQAATSQAAQPLTFAFFGDGDTHPFTFYPGDTATAQRAMMCRHWDGWEQEYKRSLNSVRTVFSWTSQTALLPDAVSPRGRAMQPSRAAAAGFAGDGVRGLPMHGAVAVDAGDAHGTAANATGGSGAAHSMRSMMNSGDADAGPLFDGAAAAKAVQQAGETERLRGIRDVMAGNLRRQEWLGGFEPLSMGCPLMGRRVSAAAVSEWAATAWDCDGLGFSWSCLDI